MPRKRKAARPYATTGKLTECQREMLLYGQPILNPDGAGFESMAEERAAWFRHRTSIMASWDRPGSRPAGFYRHDLKIDPPPWHWHEELSALEARGLLSRVEELRVEGANPALDPRQGEHFLNPKYLTPRGLFGFGELTNASLYILRRMRDEALFAAGWHQRRNRPELAEKCTRRAAIFDGWIKSRKGINP